MGRGEEKESGRKGGSVREIRTGSSHLLFPVAITHSL